MRWYFTCSRMTIFFFWLCHVASRILVSQIGIDPIPPALEAWSLNNWTTREVPRMTNFLMSIEIEHPGCEEIHSCWEATQKSNWVTSITTQMDLGLIYAKSHSGYKFERNSYIDGASPVVQSVKHLPAMREAWVQFLGLEDPLEKKMAPHSRLLAWRIPWTEGPGSLQFTGSQESDTT